jgi:hypothetical protein
MSAPLTTPPLPDAPYRGIEPFRFTDQQIFAARSEETWTLLSNVTLYRAVLLYGASGTGKSSLINAGFLPQAVKENYVPDRIRVQPFAGREIKVERIRVSGNEENASYLTSNFEAPEGEESSKSIELSLAAFKAALEKFRLQPTESAGSLFQVVPTARPLLIFDQFEEFITLFEEAQRVGSAAQTKLALEQVPAAQQDILATLVDLIQDDTLPIKIIFSFREDYLAKLSLLFDYCPELMDQSQRLLPPSIEELPQIIRAPFTNPELRAHFLKTTKGAGSEISESLAQKISDELAHRSEGDTANLTELQIVCQRLWQASDAEAMFAKDGIEGLLKSYGTDVFRHFAPELRDPAVVLLSHMITASNTRNIISEEDLLSRTGECDFEPAQCSNALAALGRSQIVRREPRHSIYFYEITSEYLVPWIKERVAERKSAEERRLAEQTQRKLEAERLQAIESLEAEQRRSRIFKRVLAAMILLGVAVIILGIFAARQYKKLHEAEAKASAAEKQNAEILKALTLITSQNPDENIEGIAKFDKLVNDGQITLELAGAAIQPLLESDDKRIFKAGFDFLQSHPTLKDAPEVAEALAEAAESNDTLAKMLRPRFYIHIADESQRAQAKQLAALLKKQDYLVPGIQNVGDKGVKSNQVRYFHDPDPGFPSPQEIVALLNNANMGKWNMRYIPGLEDSPRTPPGQFELWFTSIAAPTPPVDQSSNGLLALTFVDDDSKAIITDQGKISVVHRERNVPIEVNPMSKQVSLAPGIWTLTVELRRYAPHKQFVNIPAGRTTNLKVFLKRRNRGYQGGPPQNRPN